MAGQLKRELNNEPVDAGLRIMIDVQENDDDKCSVKIDDQAVLNETEYTGNLPAIWSAETDSIKVYGKEDTPADSLIIANWDRLYQNKNDTDAKSDTTLNDTAIAYVWDTKSLETEANYGIFYGMKNRSVSQSSDNSEPTEESSAPESSAEASEESSQASGFLQKISEVSYELS